MSSGWATTANARSAIAQVLLSWTLQLRRGPIRPMRFYLTLVGRFPRLCRSCGLVLATRLATRWCQAMRLEERRVHCGTPIRKSVNFVFAWNANQVLLAGKLRIDLGVEDLLLVARSAVQDLTVWVTQLTLADEGESSFGADTVDGQKVNGILQGPAADGALRDTLGTGWPVRGQNNQIGAQQRQATRCLRKRSVVADVDTKLQLAGGVHGKGTIAVVSKTVNTQKGQMDFAIASDQPSGPTNAAALNRRS